MVPTLDGAGASESFRVFLLLETCHQLRISSQTSKALMTFFIFFPLSPFFRQGLKGRGRDSGIAMESPAIHPDAIGHGGRLSEMEARGLFAQMAEALRHSHALDVVHRDRMGIWLVVKIDGNQGINLDRCPHTQRQLCFSPAL